MGSTEVDWVRMVGGVSVMGPVKVMGGVSVMDKISVMGKVSMIIEASMIGLVSVVGGVSVGHGVSRGRWGHDGECSLCDGPSQGRGQCQCDGWGYCWASRGPWRQHGTESP